jgi:hypothetical protein
MTAAIVYKTRGRIRSSKPPWISATVAIEKTAKKMTNTCWTSAPGTTAGSRFCDGVEG